jgi:hypothetical protein
MLYPTELRAHTGATLFCSSFTGGRVAHRLYNKNFPEAIIAGFPYARAGVEPYLAWINVPNFLLQDSATFFLRRESTLQ